MNLAELTSFESSAIVFIVGAAVGAFLEARYGPKVIAAVTKAEAQVKAAEDAVKKV